MMQSRRMAKGDHEILFEARYLYKRRRVLEIDKSYSLRMRSDDVLHVMMYQEE